MDQTKIQTFKKQLEGVLKFVEGELKSMGRENPTTDHWEATSSDMDESATEPDELADRQEEYEENKDEIDTIEKHWHNIKRALGKIEDGSYGICEISGEEIEEDRLEANPSARTCKMHMDDEAVLPE